MTWFKVDDGFWSHPKTATLSDAAVTLWVRAGAYCCQHLTDGVVPRGALRFLGVEAGADQLVEAGLWDIADTGWVFHDWAQYQPSRESVLAERASNSARQAVARNPELRDAVRQRDGNQCRYCGQTVEWNNKRGGAGGTYDHINPKGPSNFENLVVCCRGCNARKGRRTPAQAGMSLIQVESESDSTSTQVTGSSRVEPPTRPGPTRPEVQKDLASQAPPPRSKQRRRIPDDYMPQRHIVDKVKGEYPALPDFTWKALHEDFCLYWIGQGKPMANWDATWLRWIRKEAAKATGVRNGTNGIATSDLRAAQTQALKLVIPDDRMELQ